MTAEDRAFISWLRMQREREDPAGEVARHYRDTRDVRPDAFLALQQHPHYAAVREEFSRVYQGSLFQALNPLP